MKWYILLFCSLIPVYANSYNCSLSPVQDIDDNIERCKLEILRVECEKQGIDLSSTTTTENFQVTKDQITSYSLCRDLKFTVTTANLSENQEDIHVEYVMDTKTLVAKPVSYAAESISYQNWTDLGKAQAKTTAKVDATKRPDSTTVINVRTNVQFDTKKVRETMGSMKKKTLAAINAFREN